MSAYLLLAHGVAAGWQGLPRLLAAHCQQNKRAMGQTVSLVLPKPQTCCSNGLENLARHSSGAQWTRAVQMYILAAPVATSLLWWLTEHRCQIFAWHCFSLSVFSISSLL